MIGLLAKGPLAMVLTFGPIFLWVLWRRRWRDLSALPWVSGFLLTALFVLPWYLAAEYKTPGFINYFIVGEHFMRFADPGWSGDLYGSAHQHAFGVIWLYWIEATFPWGIVAAALFIRRWIDIWRQKSIPDRGFSDMQRLLLLASFFPSLFFTFSGNILATYQLPALAPLSILLAMRITRPHSEVILKNRGMIFTAACVPLLGMLFGVTSSFYPEKLKTEKNLVAYYNRHKNAHSQPLMYIGKPPFSARFYSKGQVRRMALPEAGALMESSSTPSAAAYFVAVRNGRVDKIDLGLSGRSQAVFSNRRFTLLQVVSPGEKTTRHGMEKNIAE